MLADEKCVPRARAQHLIVPVVDALGDARPRHAAQLVHHALALGRLLPLGGRGLRLGLHALGPLLLGLGGRVVVEHARGLAAALERLRGHAAVIAGR
jgi:hypothetical protein